jgi:hypothetical protein
MYEVVTPYMEDVLLHSTVAIEVHLNSEFLPVLTGLPPVEVHLAIYVYQSLQEEVCPHVPIQSL